jgi:CheY-like chemotaxis protein
LGAENKTNMADRDVRLLHIEDDPFQQEVVRLHLARLTDLKFAITHATNEAEAVTAFRDNPPDCVVLDYRLEQSNGLSCLQNIRRLDPVVPIIALTGETSPGIATRLLQNGADDYINKAKLNGQILEKSIRKALQRSEAWNRRTGGTETPVDPTARFRKDFRQVCGTFVTRLGDAFFDSLAACEAVARGDGLTEQQLGEALDTVCREISAERSGGNAAVGPRIRPLLLELRARFHEQPPAPK